jgi:hypothetical protein
MWGSSTITSLPPTAPPLSGTESDVQQGIILENGLFHLWYSVSNSGYCMAMDHPFLVSLVEAK